MKITNKNISFIYFILSLVPICLYSQSINSINTIDLNVCPFECCRFGKWICKDTINVYEQEGDTSVVQYTLLNNDTIYSYTGNVHIEKFGKVVVTKPVYDFLTNDTLIVTYCCGDEDFYLYKNNIKYCTEIFWPFLLYEEDVHDRYFYDEYLKDLKDPFYSGIMIERPQIVWWVKIMKNGISGWLFLKNKTPFCFDIDENIDGMDGCG
jgi:hypothetical protein